MGRRGWKTINDTKRARSTQHDAVTREREQRSMVSAALAAAARPYDTESVRERLDRRDELDRKHSAERLAAYQPLDLGDL